jgi:hypothetical protein
MDIHGIVVIDVRVYTKGAGWAWKRLKVRLKSLANAFQI